VDFLAAYGAAIAPYLRQQVPRRPRAFVFELETDGGGPGFVSHRAILAQQRDLEIARLNYITQRI